MAASACAFSVPFPSRSLGPAVRTGGSFSSEHNGVTTNPDFAWLLRAEVDGFIFRTWQWARRKGVQLDSHFQHSNSDLLLQFLGPVCLAWQQPLTNHRFGWSWTSAQGSETALRKLHMAVLGLKVGRGMSYNFASVDRIMSYNFAPVGRRMRCNFAPVAEEPTSRRQTSKSIPQRVLGRPRPSADLAFIRHLR